ncbi:MAG TPA: HD-GYP domain-containing protein [Candidatus Acidoferrales bacterium]|nr:HD-GYP domain-containing protein [Candidatus Acidoferrales bacterium]
MTQHNPESAELYLTKHARTSGPRRESLRIQRLEEHIQTFQRATICALNQMLDLKDLNTGVHSTRLAEWALSVGAGIGIAAADLRDLEIAAILHDIGKVGVPDSVLKKNGPLDADERKIIEKHSEFGWTILREIPGFERASLLVLHHHERIDGKGYPAKLKGEEIPFGSRIVCVVDAFDAMVSDRAYRKGLPMEEALRRLRNDRSTQFDARIVDHFIRIAAQEFPDIAAIADPTISP